VLSFFLKKKKNVKVDSHTVALATGQKDPFIRFSLGLIFAPDLYTGSLWTSGDRS
jgi:hypothetical protein